MEARDRQHAARRTGPPQVIEAPLGEFPKKRLKPGVPFKKPAASRTGPAVLAPQTLSTSFVGVSLTDEFNSFGFGSFPPDTMGAIGPNHFMIVINGGVGIYNRTGARLSFVSLDSFFAATIGGVNYPRNGSFDTRVIFDRRSGRWMAVALETGQIARVDNDIILAVSATSDATGVWNKFLVPVGDPTSGGTTFFSDFETLGTDDNGVYSGLRIFPTPGNSFAKIVAIPKSQVLSAGTASVNVFTNITDMFSSPQPAHNLDAVPASGRAWFVASSSTVFGNLNYRRLTWSGTTPTLDGTSSVVTTPGFGGQPLNAPASGSTTSINVGDVRVQMATIRANSLWTCRQLGLDASGGTGAPTRTGCEWLQLNVTGATATLVQSGRVFDSAASNPRYFFFPSIMPSGQGHVVMGFSGVRSDEFVGGYFTGRLSGDPTGTMGSNVLFKAGEGAYNRNDGSGRNRWGDYSYTSLDPNDDMSLWTVQEYALPPASASDSRWGTWVAKTLAPPPATPLSCNPPTVPPGQANVSVTVTGSSVSGSGFYDPGTGFPNRLGAAVGGVVVNSVTFNSPTSVTLSLNTNGASTGPKDVTITNPDAQSRTGTAILTITPGGGTSPVVTTSPGSGNYLENQPATTIDPGLTLTDADSANLVGGTVAITTNFASGQDTLAFANQGGISGSYNGTTGVLSLSGTASVATYQTALRSVTYVNSSDNPSTASRTVTFTVNDGTGSGSGNRSVSVTPVNDAPTLAAIANPAPIPQDSGTQTVNLSGITAGGGESQTLTVTATSNNLALIPNPTVTYASPNATGSLSYAPVAGQVGSAVITVTVTDDGGTASGGVNSVQQTFTVAVTGGPVGVNDPPSFTKGPDITHPIDGGPFTQVGWATNISPGPPDESAQTVNFIVTPADPLLFADPPAVSSTGTLTFTPASGDSGSTNVTVVARDNGGTANGGVDTSAPQSFTITIGAAPEPLGTYVGVITADPAGPREHARFGAISVTVSRRGTFSARLTLGGTRYRARGLFAPPVNGSATGSFTRAVFALRSEDAPENGSRLSLAIELGVNAAGLITGVITESGSPYSTLSAEQAIYTRKKRPKPPLVNPPRDLLGKYTVLFPPLSPAEQGRPAAEFPQGDGYATGSVSKKGSARFRGALADGTKFSYGNRLTKSNVFPFHVVTDKRKGSVTGSLTFRDQAGTDFDATDLVWFKPDTSGSRKRAKSYPSGWANGIFVDVAGSAFDTQRRQPILTSLPPPDSDGNARVTFTDGGLPAGGVIIGVNIDDRNRIEIVTAGLDRLKLKVSSKTGLLTGEFTHPDTGRKTSLRGVVTQKTQRADGFFVSSEESGGLELVADGP